MENNIQALKKKILTEGKVKFDNKLDIFNYFKVDLDIIELNLKDFGGKTQYFEIQKDNSNINISLVKEISLVDKWVFQKTLPEIQDLFRQVLKEIIVRNTAINGSDFHIIHNDTTLLWSISKTISVAELNDLNIITILKNLLIINNNIYDELSELLNALGDQSLYDLIIEMYTVFGKLYIPIENMKKRSSDVWRVKDPKTKEFFIFKKKIYADMNEITEKLNLLSKIANNPSTYVSNLIDFENIKTIIYTIKEYIIGNKLGFDMKLPELKMFHIIREVALGLKYFHDQGILYLDIKHENIVIDRDDNPKIIDIHTIAFENSERATTFRGTPVYISPEMLLYEPKPCRSSDIFSLGIIFYEMALNEMPFPEAFAILDNREIARFQGAREHAPDGLWRLSDDLREIIGKMISLNSADRYHDIEDFIADIDKLIEKRGRVLSNSSSWDLPSDIQFWLLSVPNPYCHLPANFPLLSDKASSAISVTRIFDYQSSKLNHFESHLAESRILTYKMNKPEEGIVILNFLLQMEPYSIDIYFEKLFALIRRDKLVDQFGNYIQFVEKSHEFENCLEEILKIDPNNIRGLMIKVDYTFDVLKDYKYVVETCKKIVGLEPIIRIFSRMAESHTELQEYTQAIECYNEILKREPQNISILLEKGDCLHNNLGDYPGAIGCYLKAISLSPDNFRNEPNIFRSLGNSYFKARNYKESIKYLEIWLQNGKNDGIIWYTKGDCHFSLNQFEKALDCFNEALKYIENKIPVLCKEVECFVSMERYSEGCEKVDEIICEISDTSLMSILLIQKSKCLIGLHMYHEAINTLDDSLRINPTNTDAIIMKEDLLKDKLQDEERAKEFIQTILEKYPQIRKYYWFKKSNEAFNKRKYFAAIDFCERAISSDFSYYDAWLKKMDSLFEVKEYGKIIDSYNDMKNKNGLFDTASKVKLFDYFINISNRLDQSVYITYAISYSIIASEIDPERFAGLSKLLFGEDTKSKIFMQLAKADTLSISENFDESIKIFKDIVDNINLIDDFKLRDLIKWYSYIQMGVQLILKRDIENAMISLQDARKLGIIEINIEKYDKMQEKLFNKFIILYDYQKVRLPLTLFELSVDLFKQDDKSSGLRCLILAIDFIDDELQLDRGNYKLLNLKNDLINLIKGVEKFENSEGFFKTLSENDPSNANKLIDYAFFLRDIRNYDKSKEYFKKAIELNPKNPIVLRAYANFLSDIYKDYDNAETYFERAIEANPNLIDNLYDYAIFLHCVRKNYKKAKIYYEKSIELEPDDTNSLANYAGILLAEGEYEKGTNLLNKALNFAIDQSIIIECLFYQYAHSRDDNIRQEAVIRLKELIRSGIRSPSWDFKNNVKKAIEDGHPDAIYLDKLARVISEGINI